MLATINPLEIWLDLIDDCEGQFALFFSKEYQIAVQFPHTCVCMCVCGVLCVYFAANLIHTFIKIWGQKANKIYNFVNKSSHFDV